MSKSDRTTTLEDLVLRYRTIDRAIRELHDDIIPGLCGPPYFDFAIRLAWDQCIYYNSQATLADLGEQTEYLLEERAVAVESMDNMASEADIY